MTAAAAASHEPIGATIAFARLDLEAACAELAGAGFGAVELWIDQLGPGTPGVVVGERHAAAAGELARAHGLRPAALNAVGDAAFDPHGDADVAADALARQLRLTAALGAPMLLVWEGRILAGADAAAAVERVAACVERARERCGLARPPTIAVEPHPFTFGFAADALDALATRLASLGDAGLLLDYAHAAVARGAAAVPALAARHRDAIVHVHVADSDARTSELHLPLGDGVLDLDAIADALAGCGAPLAWDLFGWPAARAAMRDGMGAYAAHRARVAGSAAR